MSLSKKFITLALMGGLIAAMATVAWGEDRISPDEAAAQQAQLQLAIAEGQVAADRAGAIASIVNKWSATMQGAGEVDQFQATLNFAANKQLAKILVATTFDQVRSILLGQELAASPEGIVIQNLGDLNNDLTFTPVNPPCRIFDTRNYGGGVPVPAGTTRSYLVYGTGAQMAAQGGNAAGCSAPKGEPVGVAANITAIPTGFQGHLRAYPFGAALPTVSFVNFTATIGANIANAGILSTCYLCASDLSIYNGSQSHSAGDIMGYFYPVSTSDPSYNEVKTASSTSGSTSITNDGAVHMVGQYVTATTASGDRVHITAMQALGTSSANASGLDLFPCYRINSPVGTPSTIGGGMFNIQTTSGTRVPMTVTGVAVPGAGTFDFGMCYRTTNTNWNNNEWGYTSILVTNF
jgi:hypothetical protein